MSANIVECMCVGLPALLGFRNFSWSIQIILGCVFKCTYHVTQPEWTGISRLHRDAFLVRVRSNPDHFLVPFSCFFSVFILFTFHELLPFRFENIVQLSFNIHVKIVLFHWPLNPIRTCFRWHDQPFTIQIKNRIQYEFVIV